MQSLRDPSGSSIAGPNNRTIRDIHLCFRQCESTFSIKNNLIISPGLSAKIQWEGSSRFTMQEIFQELFIACWRPRTN